MYAPGKGEELYYQVSLFLLWKGGNKKTETEELIKSIFTGQRVTVDLKRDQPCRERKQHGHKSGFP